jgi:outer membrane protein
MKVSRSALLAALVVLVAGASHAAVLPPVDFSKPLGADECVRLALERNYAILLAGDQLDQARASKLSAWGTLTPRLSAGWNYDHSKSQFTQDPPNPVRASEPIASDSRGYGVQASQTLLSIPNILSIAAQRRYTGAAENDVRDVEQQVALAVRQQYYGLIEAIKLLDVSREDSDLAGEELKRTESLFDVGSVARTDVLKARVRVASASSALTAAENNVQVQRARLGQALALPTGAEVQVVESLEPRAGMPDSASAYGEALANRPDLKAAALRLQAARTGRKAAYAGKIPYLSHSFSRNFTRSPGTGTVGIDFLSDPISVITGRVTETSSSWNYSIGFSWNILDGLVTEGNIQRSIAAQSQAEHQAGQLSLQVGQDVKEALLAIRAARQQILSAREGRTSAEEDLKLSQERYSVGLGTVLELIDAQVNLTRARTAEVQAMAALKRAEAQLDKATGRVNW